MVTKLTWFAGIQRGSDTRPTLRSHAKSPGLHRTRNPVPERECGFDSHLRHQGKAVAEAAWVAPALLVTPSRTVEANFSHDA
jgi:hypothetical protein